MFKVFAAFVVVTLLVANAVRADEPDTSLADQVRRREKIEAQKIEAEYRQAFTELQRLAKSDPLGALPRLKRMLTQVAQDGGVPQDRRDALQRLFRDQIRITQAEITGEAEPAQTKKQPSDRRRQEKGRNDDTDKIQQRLKNIRDLQNEGKTAEASRASAELAERHPDDVRLQAAQRAAGAIDQINNARKVRLQQERSVVGSMLDMDKSITPAGQDLEFPKDWKERTKGRSSGVQLSEKEKAIINSLNTVVSVSFKNAKLEEAIDYLQKITNQPIILDQEGLKDADASYDSPVTLNVKGVTLRTALRKILAELGLTYVVKDETIQVTSQLRAKDMMVVRRYYIGDLLATMGPLAQIGGIPRNINDIKAFQELQTKQNADSAQQLIEMIVSTVDTGSWQRSGGFGTIVYHAPTASLIIRQSAEVHALLGGGLLK